MWRRFRGHLMTGQGQVLRVALADGLFLAHARALNRYLAFLAFVAVGLLAATASLLADRPRYIAAWGVVSAAGLAALVVKSRSIRKPFWVLADWALSAPAILVGFLRPLPEPGAFSLERAIEWTAALPLEAMARPGPGRAAASGQRTS